MDQIPNIRAKTLIIFKEKKGLKSHDLGLGSSFLGMIFKAQVEQWKK